MEDQMMDANDKMIDANDKMMSGGGAAMSKGYKKMKSKLYGYKEFTLDGKNYRVYGDMKGMTPREYIESWGKPLKRSPSAKRSAPVPQPRRSARIRERDEKRRASMGGKRKSNKSKKTRKARK